MDENEFEMLKLEGPRIKNMIFGKIIPDLWGMFLYNWLLIFDI